MKTLNISKIIFLMVISAMLLWSCQKEIQIDLNSAAPQIVIEGSVSDMLGKDTVKLSQTVNYYNLNIFPGISGAMVKISDNAGYFETLTEIDSVHGIYITKPLRGIPGRTYTLNVLANGKEYTSVSTMPEPVKIDSLGITVNIRSGRGNPFGGSNSRNTNDTTYRVTVNFRDPAGIENYYRFVETNNGITYNSISVISDRFRDGKEISREMRIDTSIHISSGNILTVEMQSIDKGAYDFFRTFRQAIGGSGTGFLSASPGNPISNISNGALGYFSAYSTDRKSIKIIP